MLKNADHVTLVVSDLQTAKQFFHLLNFIEVYTTVIEGEPFSSYMSIPGLKADHVTLVLYHGDEEAKPRFEIQLLHFHHPDPQIDVNISRLDKYGYNHLCFAVTNIQECMEKLRKNNVKILSEVLHFHARKLVFFEGPDGIVLELTERESS